MEKSILIKKTVRNPGSVRLRTLFMIQFGDPLVSSRPARPFGFRVLTKATAEEWRGSYSQLCKAFDNIV